MANLKKIINFKNVYIKDISEDTIRQLDKKKDKDFFLNEDCELYFYNIDLSPLEQIKKKKKIDKEIKELELIDEEEKTEEEKYKEKWLNKKGNMNFNNLISVFFKDKIIELEAYLEQNNNFQDLFNKKIKPILIVKNKKTYYIFVSFGNFARYLKITWIKCPASLLLDNLEWELDNFMFYDRAYNKVYSIFGEEKEWTIPISEEEED